MSHVSGGRFQDKLPLSKALLIVLLSTLLVSGTATLAWLYFQYIQYKREHDPAFNIVAIVQSGPEREGLKTVYLAELLDLSVDNPKNLYAFDTKAGRQKLKASPLIRTASLKRIRPGTLYIDCTVRQPMAYLADYANTAMDADRCIFPFAPFFTPKRLPEIYLGLPAFGASADAQGRMGGTWCRPLRGKHIDLAMELLDYFSHSDKYAATHLIRIDVSKAFAESYGEREIIVVMEDYIERQEGGKSALSIFPRTLRLAMNNYKMQLANYDTLRKYLNERTGKVAEGGASMMRAEPMTIDMRIEDLAFLK